MQMNLTHLIPGTQKNRNLTKWELGLNENAQTPVFIVGCGRSGTTLLLSILAADPDFYCIPDESEMFRWHIQPDFTEFLHEHATLEGLWQYNQNLFQDTLPKPEQAQQVLQHFRKTLSRYPAPPSTATHWVEKTPSHIRRVSLIREQFAGRAKFIQIVRDGRDVVLSNHPNKGREFHIHFNRWVYDVGLGLEFEHDADMHILQYEHLIQNFEDTMSGIYHFLEKPLPPAVFDFEHTSQIQWHDAWRKKIRSLNSDSIGRWRAPEFEDRIQDFVNTPLAATLLERYGYLEGTAYPFDQ